MGIHPTEVTDEMYYTNSRMEAFVRPRKPEGVDNKTAYIVGSGLAGLAAAAFLVRDGQMPGQNVTVLEEMDVSGGALDGIEHPNKGFIIRGGREMEEHFVCLWDLFSSVPSLEEPGASVTEENYWLNKRDPNYSLQRATVRRGEDAQTGNKFGLSEKAEKDLMQLFLKKPEDFEGKRINEVLGKEFFESNMWMYWRTMFAFQEWHSALEMKLYMHRFICHIKHLPDLSSLKFTKYNQYESLALPLQRYLESKGVKFQFATEVTDIDFEIRADGSKQATRIDWIQSGKPGSVTLGPNDLVFTTIGSLTENSDAGDHDAPAKINDGPAPAWDLWRKIAARDPSFGHPDVFDTDIPKTKWESATVTTLDMRIPPYIQKICKRDPFSGKVVTGGIVTAKDSAWLLSWTVNRQPHFKAQPKGQLVVWVYALRMETPGDYVKKHMQDCTGEEITREWLYHIGVPVDQIDDMAANSARTIPVMMPYVTSFFMPRHKGDRPDVVPEGAVNFAFLGQFAEIRRDTIFTTEYSVRTGMEAVYKLLKIDKGVPEVHPGCYDIRVLLESTRYLRDGKKYKAPWWLPTCIWNWLLAKIDRTVAGPLIRDNELV